ncbi:hypothetical protein CONLIGDRAFT_681647 [Coniochaeta ligniaria NRRL 30616]|uniref:Uncharacterized protein n=1 Tax=Coniochaeta ligniaria NRRL 30616 TaxID=1408157 RepID=A0A1J7IM97_9PEZI|nr:hypothetical protein CONLIGDRAFT_681647 [Coniochaeta ligniaria NRRL 30616]
MGSTSDPVWGSGESNMLTAAVACHELGEELKLHRAALQLRVFELRRSSAKDKTILAELRAKQLELEASRNTKTARLSYLDLPHLEKIPPDQINGQTSLSESKSYRALRPTFKFSITTDCPIRSWHRHQSDGVKWDPVVCPEAGRKLTATARAKSFVKSNAELELYGWRKEVHVREIDQLKLSLTSLETEIDSVTGAAKRVDSRIDQAARDLSIIETELAICEQVDLEAVRKSTMLGPRSHDATRRQPYCDAGSVSGYATVLGLKSQVDAPKGITSTSDGLLLMSTMDACQAEFQSAKVTMERYCTQQRWAVSGDGKSEITAINRSLWDGFAPNIDFSSVLSKLSSPLSTDDEFLILVSECRQDIRQLQSAALQAKSELTLKLGQLPNSAKNGTRDGELYSAQRQLAKQSNALDRTCVWIKAEKQPVGVAAALRSTRYQGPGAKLEAFLSVYRGEMIRAGM